MTEPTMVSAAAMAPGECVLSGDFHGPFIDTGFWLNGYGRIYISLKALGPLMRDAGWVPREEVVNDLEKSEKFLAQAADLRYRAELYDSLREAIQPLMPTPEPITKQVAVYKDDRVRTDNEQLLAENRRLQHENAELRSTLIEDPPDPTPAAPAPDGEGSSSEPESATPSSTAVEEGQEVDLDLLLSRNVHDIAAVAEGRSVDFRERLAMREMEIAEANERKPRKMVLALYEDES